MFSFKWVFLDDVFVKPRETSQCDFKIVDWDVNHFFKSTYEELLNKANIPFLHIKSIRTMAVETLHILNDMSPPALSDLLRIRDCSTYNFRYQNVYSCRMFAQQIVVRKVSDLQLPSCGI